MDWFGQLRQVLQAYYPADRAPDIVGYLQGSGSPDVWRSMELGDPSRNQMIILGNVEPTREDWDAAGVAQRGEVQVVRLSALAGFIILYGGFIRRPWGKIYIVDDEALTVFPATLEHWRDALRHPRR